MLEKGNKKIIRAWTFYDWANSVYPLVVTTAIFPPFYEAITSSEETDMVSFFGLDLHNSALYAYVVSASFLVVAILSPLLSGVADYWGNKKFFLKVFCYLGAGAVGSMYFFGNFFDAGLLELGMLSLFLASIGFWGSLVYYNAFLPEIAEPEDHDSISARGYSLGYFGSSILLIIILAIYLGKFIPGPPNWSFPIVMIWWIGFAQYTFFRLPKFAYHHNKAGKGILYKGFHELQKVWQELKTLKVIKRYLTAYFFYSMGVQTVMLMAVIFAAKEVQWEDDGKTGLIISVLIIQFIAIPGAFAFSKGSAIWGNISVLKVAVFFWIVVCTWAYFIHLPWQFYLTAVGVGFVMGGIQSLSRSTYSKMLPETEDHASYFSFYDMLEKLGIMIGTLVFASIETYTDNIRDSIFGIIISFVIGLILLFRVPKEKRVNPNG
ncbi:MFS transporter [bacterium SCSIO 12741]|nr:MFS transporter [bacterium SCSIO 12741]